jgi:hypothetical protein
MQRKLRRREKAGLRRPPEPDVPIRVDTRQKRDASQLSTASQQQYLPREKRRRGAANAGDLTRHFEASNIPVKRLTVSYIVRNRHRSSSSS